MKEQNVKKKPKTWEEGMKEMRDWEERGIYQAAKHQMSKKPQPSSTGVKKKD